MAQKYQIDFVVLTATYPDMAKISTKLEMKKFKSVHWKNYKDDFGEKWFPKSMDQLTVEGYYKSVFGEIEWNKIPMYINIKSRFHKRIKS